MHEIAATDPLRVEQVAPPAVAKAPLQIHERALFWDRRRLDCSAALRLLPKQAGETPAVPGKSAPWLTFYKLELSDAGNVRAGGEAPTQ